LQGWLWGEERKIVEDNKHNT